MSDAVTWHDRDDQQPPQNERPSHWWATCLDCTHVASFTGPRVRYADPLDSIVDAGLLAAALDLAEHQGDSGHQRCVLWTGDAAAHRAPTAAELGVCAEHPAYVIPEWGGRWLATPNTRDCALMVRAFEVEYGYGFVTKRGYPLAHAGHSDARHSPSREITASEVLTDDAQVCRPCVCLAHGVKVHGVPRHGGGSSPSH